MLYAYAVLESVTRTLQQQIGHRLPGLGLGGRCRKHEHFRRIERVSHLNRRSLQLRRRCWQGNDRGRAYDSQSGRISICRAPRHRRRNTHNCRSEREANDEIVSRRPPANEA
jgi:hypothetical protein